MYSVLFCYFLLQVQSSQAQFTTGLKSLSVSATNTQFGLPFLKFFPIHPGLDIGVTFLENEKSKSIHKVNAHLGYIYHNVLVTGPYLKGEYAIQFKVKDIIGLDVGLGGGGFYAIYPGDAYVFDQDSKNYETIHNQQFFLTVNAGVGLTWLKATNVQPFIRYEVMTLGSPDLTLSLAKLGVHIPLKK